ncbi:hypothetical protein [Halogeometricum luteum]|uniref:DUF8215 domain-containing protein n=1 Tax=Halogeometricum luteum TaxID=2950537 RepID=A0ABU2G216_9EURY|nr:hypothetical protein [Halogeometricum sp. S3BR5-2]MDS0294826.1 hypothetical protein [Halogeometricum sp. S3BR5-2]
MVRRAAGTIRRFDRYLNQSLTAGMEVSTLAVPTLWFLLFARPAEAVALSALTALCATPLAVAAFRGGYVGGAQWPAPGHLGTLAGRSAYYSLVVGGGTYLGVAANLHWGSFALGVLVPAVACAVAVSALPRAFRSLARLSRLSL